VPINPIQNPLYSSRKPLIGDNIKMDLRGTGCGRMDWFDMAQDRDQWRALVNTAMNLWAS
jgi:hypothetical protein